MRFADRYIQTAGEIISSYEGTVPLHHFLKQFYATDKKYGSKDRKAISHACYCYYRLGKTLMNEPIDKKIKAGIFLCNEKPGGWQSIFEESWLENWSEDLQKRLAFITSRLPFHINKLFPFGTELSSALDKNAFILSHLVQPDLFLRIRPGKQVKVLMQLSGAGIAYQQKDNCIALPNSTKTGGLLSLDKDVVVQDLSSQKIAELFAVIPSSHAIKTWDCCAASGGKSILAYDTFQNIDLTVSDVRPSIIRNLKKRFAEAGIKDYRSFLADLGNSTFNIQPAAYDLIICDAPCSGSGTWGRTPEQLYYFEEERIEHYATLQKKIVANVIPALKQNGYLLYITCSVFKKENEAVADHIRANTSLQLVEMNYLEGYDKKADTMFAALFTASEP
jgi:16S rRNA (cytosine967-C5)-methyltransferase